MLIYKHTSITIQKSPVSGWKIYVFLLEAINARGRKERKYAAGDFTPAKLFQMKMNSPSLVEVEYFPEKIVIMKVD